MKLSNHKLKMGIIFTMTFCIIGTISIKSKKNTEPQCETLILNPIGKMGSDGKVTSVNIDIDNFNKDNKNTVAFKVSGQEYTKEEVNKVKKKLGFQNAKYSKDEDTKINTYTNKKGATMSYSDESGLFSYYSENVTSGKSDKPIKNKLTDQVYKEKAEKYIDNLGIFDIKDYNYAGVTPSMFSEYYPTEDATEPVTEVLRYEVIFSTKPVEEFEFDGVGPGIKVSFDATGEVCDFMVISKDVEKIQKKKYEMKTKEEVEDALLKNENCIISNIYGEENEIRLDDYELILYSDEANAVQEYAVPHYHITGKNLTSNEAIDVIIPAVKEKYISYKNK